jgi:hypothetical protein
MSQIASLTKNTINNLQTPQLLKGGLYLTWAACALVLFTTISGVQRQKKAIQIVGQQTAPSIIDAQTIKSGLADLDANLANELLAPYGQNPQAVESADQRRQETFKAIISAAKNISSGDKEKIPLQNLNIGINDYMAKIYQARSFHQQNNNAGMLEAYRQAIEIMDKKLVPAIDGLDKTNLQRLDNTYNQEQIATIGSLISLGLSAISLIGTLVWLQKFLSDRTRRTLNPMLFAATVIAVLFLGTVIKSSLSAYHQLGVAKEDAFKSIHALWQARALGYSANGDESRFLLDPQLASQHQQAFAIKIAKIVNIPPGESFDSVATKTAWGDKVPGFSGYLADAANNIKFKSERAAALTTMSNFSTYDTTHRQILELNQKGQRNLAILFATGKQLGESDWAFNQFDEALGKTIDINQQLFNKSVQGGLREINGFEFTTPVAIGAIALLTLLGLQPRLKEYYD